MTSPDIVLRVYIALLVVGGLIGFFKAGSKISLVMAAGFAVLLGLCAFRVLRVPWLPELLLGVLLVVFSHRLRKTSKFMPSGLMLILTACALLLRLWLAQPGVGVKP